MAYQKFVIGFDPHAPHQDKNTEAAFFRHIEAYKPKYRVAGGDVFDVAPLRTGATAEERRHSIESDVDRGLAWLIRFEPTHGVWGNHDYRLWRGLKSADGMTRQVCQESVARIEKTLKNLGVSFKPYNVRSNFLRLPGADFLIAHGSWYGENAATNAVKDCKESVIFGHGHGAQFVEMRGACRRYFGMMGSALCRLDLEYAETRMATTAWRNGWVYGACEARRESVAWQAKKSGSLWLLPTGLESF